MRRFLFLVISFSCCLSAFAQKKISEYPNTASIAGTDLLLLASGSTNKNIRWNQVRSYIDVRDYGAIGDGTTENTTAFVNADAAAALSNQWVFVPPGNYVSDTIHITASGWTGVGTNSHLRFKDGSSGAFLIASNRAVYVKNMAIDGGSTETWNATGKTPGTRIGLLHDSISISEVSGLDVHGFDLAGIQVGVSSTLERTCQAVYQNNWLHDNFIGHTNAPGCGEYTRISANRVWNCFVGIGTKAANLLVSDNIISDCWNGGFWDADAGGRGHCKWINNTFNHLGGDYGLKINLVETGGTVCGNSFYVSRSIVIVNCKGIQIFGNVGDGPALMVDTAGSHTSIGITYHDNMCSGAMTDYSTKVIHYNNYSMDGVLQDHLGSGWYSSGGYGMQTNQVFKIMDVPAHADNTAAVAAGLAVGSIYRITGADTIAIVH